jgi:hypothetical protein
MSSWEMPTEISEIENFGAWVVSAVGGTHFLGWSLKCWFAIVFPLATSLDSRATDGIATALLGHYYCSVSTKRKYLLGMSGTLLLLILIVWRPWSALLYHGDGRFSDRLFFYPRYWIRLTDISINEEGEHHFHLAGLPHDEMSLVLYRQRFKGRFG